MIRFFTKTENGSMVCTTEPEFVLTMSKELTDKVLSMYSNAWFDSCDKYAKLDPSSLYLDVAEDSIGNVMEAAPVRFIDVTVEENQKFLHDNFNGFKEYAFMLMMARGMAYEDKYDKPINAKSCDHFKVYTAISNNGSIPMVLSHYQDKNKKNFWYVYGIMTLYNNRVREDDIEINTDDNGVVGSVLEPPCKKECYFAITWKEIKKLFHDIKPLYF